jgi:hypothetical protein
MKHAQRDSMTPLPVSYELFYHDRPSAPADWRLWLTPVFGLPHVTLPYLLDFRTLTTLQIEQISVIGAEICHHFVDLAFKELIDAYQPVTVWLEEPFCKTIKITIAPLHRTMTIESMRDYPPTNESHFNYYIWQTSMVVAQLYTQHLPMVSPLKASLSELWLKGIEVHSENELKFQVGWK